MEKFLFTDGSDGMREVQSQEELNTLIESSPQPEKVKVWVFNTNEWISYNQFGKKIPAFQSRHLPPAHPATEPLQAKPPRKNRGLKKFLFMLLGAAAIFLIYNFTRIRWEHAQPVTVAAAWPANVLQTNPDSLIQYMEENRGQKLDKITRTNLRIRNTWPERIALQVSADRDSSSLGLRYYNMELAIDNSTGYNLDNAIVKLTVWKNHEVSATDTFHFNNISYALAARRKLNSFYRGDSLSIGFQLIKARVFNFCYSATKKSNYGNDNDRWFFRE